MFLPPPSWSLVAAALSGRPWMQVLSRGGGGGGGLAGTAGGLVSSSHAAPPSVLPAGPMGIPFFIIFYPCPSWFALETHSNLKEVGCHCQLLVFTQPFSFLSTLYVVIHLPTALSFLTPNLTQRLYLLLIMSNIHSHPWTHWLFFFHIINRIK